MTRCTLGIIRAVHNGYDSDIIFTDTIYTQGMLLRHLDITIRLRIWIRLNLHLNSSFSIDHEIDTSMRIHTDQQKLQFVYFNHIIKFNRAPE
jgi:hypothetical protein